MDREIGTSPALLGHETALLREAQFFTTQAEPHLLKLQYSEARGNGGKAISLITVQMQLMLGKTRHWSSVGA